MFEKLKDYLQLITNPAPEVNLYSRPDGSMFGVRRRDYETIELPRAQTRPIGRHVFRDMASFAAHLNRYKAYQDDANIMFNPNQCAVRATLNPSDWDSDEIDLELQLHPQMELWLDLIQARQKSTKEIIDAMHALEGTYALPSGTDVIDGFVSKLNSVQYTRTSKISVSYSDIGAATVSSDRQGELSVKLPPALVVTAPYFLDDPEPVTFDIRVQLVEPEDGSPKKLYFRFECPELLIVRYKAVQAAVERLRKELGEGWHVGIGQHRIAT